MEIPTHVFDFVCFSNSLYAIDRKIKKSKQSMRKQDHSARSSFQSSVLKGSVHPAGSLWGLLGNFTSGWPHRRMLISNNMTATQ